MTLLGEKQVVDTNVLINANKTVNPLAIPVELIFCVEKCRESIERIREEGILVIDSGNEIFDEYHGMSRRDHGSRLSLSGQPGPGDAFLKWIHDKRWDEELIETVTITRQDDGYLELPPQMPDDFDLSDKKFIAVAYAHNDKPVVLQATDSKWWGWKDDLESAGLNVKFICPDYIREKYRKKFPNKGKQEKDS